MKVYALRLRGGIRARSFASYLLVLTLFSQIFPRFPANFLLDEKLNRKSNEGVHFKGVSTLLAESSQKMLKEEKWETLAEFVDACISYAS